ncbi:MAG: response regulator transcription factor [Ferruginibacter sp.]|nr:response regulator transcription factor [Ferruginibacter sp.]
MKLQCLLIDDEPPALKVLSRYISEVGGMEIVSQCNNAIEAIKVLREHKVDVIFLDIKMPRIIGTDFLKNLSQPPKVIFVTAYREYAVEGFELDAIDYLVKPVSFERFLKAITKLNRLLGNETSAISSPSTQDLYESFIYLKVDKDMKKIFIGNIMYIESCKDYVTIFLADGKKLLVKQSISAIENLLSDLKFLRVHRSYIISINKVSGYNSLSVQLGETEIPIGRLYKQTVMDRLQNGW